MLRVVTQLARNKLPPSFFRGSAARQAWISTFLLSHPRYFLRDHHSCSRRDVGLGHGSGYPDVARVAGLPVKPPLETVAPEKIVRGILFLAEPG